MIALRLLTQIARNQPPRPSGSNVEGLLDGLLKTVSWYVWLDGVKCALLGVALVGVFVGLLARVLPRSRCPSCGR